MQPKKYSIGYRKKPWPQNIAIDICKGTEHTPSPNISELDVEYCLAGLDEKRYIVIKLLYKKGATLQAIGEQLGVSKERIRQMKNTGIKLLQTDWVFEVMERGLAEYRHDKEQKYSCALEKAKYVDMLFDSNDATIPIEKLEPLTPCTINHLRHHNVYTFRDLIIFFFLSKEVYLHMSARDMELIKMALVKKSKKYTEDKS